MVGKSAIAECEWWKFNFPRLLILLILTPTILSENCTELQVNSQDILKNIHDYAYSLRAHLQLREKDTRGLLKNVSDYINGIVNSRDEMDKTYNASDLTEFDFLNMDCWCHRKGSFHGQRSESSYVQGIIPPDGGDSSVQHTIDINATVKLDSRISETITALRNNDYDKATSALNLITDDNTIYTVVNSIYKEDPVNAFNVILNLSDKLTNVRRIFLFYNAIHNEMEISNDSDGYKHLILIEHINRKVLQQSWINETTKLDALKLLKVLRDKTKKVGTDFLRAVFVFKNSSDIESGNELLNKTYYTDESLFEEIHQEFLIMMKLNGMYNETFNNVLKLTRSRHQPEQELLLHVINIFIIKNYDKIETNKFSELFKEYLNIVQGLKGKVNEEKIQKYSEKLKPTMSLSIYNMLSSEKLCIKNVGLGTYLNTGKGNERFYKLNDTNPRLKVYLTEKCSSDGYGIWKLEHINNVMYYLKSVSYDQYVEPLPQLLINDRRVTWMWEKTTKDAWCYWRIEESGDYVYIKSDKTNEYLYGSSRTGDTTKDWYKGHIYTLKNKYNICPNQECVWLIEDCSNSVD